MYAVYVYWVNCIKKNFLCVVEQKNMYFCSTFVDNILVFASLNKQILAFDTSFVYACEGHLRQSTVTKVYKAARRSKFLFVIV